jgi:hypothetical protein
MNEIVGRTHHYAQAGWNAQKPMYLFRIQHVKFDIASD